MLSKFCKKELKMFNLNMNKLENSKFRSIDKTKRKYKVIQSETRKPKTLASFNRIRITL
jgi:hypothetical protein